MAALDKQNGFLERALSPYPFLAGVLFSYIACCILGRVLSRQNPFKDFTHLHPPISHLTLYYPTASQLRAVARSRMDPERIAVVVGGSSIMNGSGQGAQHLWTKQLQALLGDRYRVCNFATFSGGPGEIGATVAEMLTRQYSKVILVTNQWPGTGYSTSDPDGIHQKYFFWDAYHKGMLTPHPARDARLAELGLQFKDHVEYNQLKLRARLDGLLYYQDLWTTFTYRCMSTVWWQAPHGSFLNPRRRFPYVDGGIPFSHRYPPHAEQTAMGYLRTSLAIARWPAVPPLQAGTRAPGAPLPDYSTSPLVSSFKLCIPEHLRRRTLVALVHYSPYYIRKLEPAQQEAYRDLFPEAILALEQGGFAAVEVGRDFADVDFNDLHHISGEGAGKMAAVIASRVQRLAAELGYLR
jgi:hypothetical protein